MLLGSYFETGWDGWADGGSDCARYSGSRSYEGNYSIYIRDNSGTASAMTSPVKTDPVMVNPAMTNPAGGEVIIYNANN